MEEYYILYQVLYAHLWRVVLIASKDADILREFDKCSLCRFFFKYQKGIVVQHDFALSFERST